MLSNFGFGWNLNTTLKNINLYWPGASHFCTFTHSLLFADNYGFPISKVNIQVNINIHLPYLVLSVNMDVISA